MKKASFFEGVMIALFSSVAVAAIFVTLSSFFISSDLFRLIITGLSFCYLLYLFARSHERVGRFTIILIWFVITILSLVFIPSLILFVSIQLAMIWLIRSLYYYSSMFSSLTDLALTAMSLLVALWAWSTSHSLFLAFWCFFLVQALFVFIPKDFTKKKKNDSQNHLTDHQKEDRFEYAYRAAEVAVRKLSTNT